MHQKLLNLESKHIKTNLCQIKLFLSTHWTNIHLYNSSGVITIRVPPCNIFTIKIFIQQWQQCYYKRKENYVYISTWLNQHKIYEISS